MSSTETTTKLTNAEYIRKQNLFKGTISVCVVYAVVALAVLIGIKYTERGKLFLEESNFPFAVTFAFGMLLIISILVYKIVTFKVDLVKRNIYDDMMCPDFWKLQETNLSDLNQFTPESRINKNYKCVKESGAPGSTEINLSKNSTDKYQRQLAALSPEMYGEANSVVPNEPTKVKLNCSMLYPQFMALKDLQNNPDSKNAMRCAYAKTCSLPWSSICPDMS